MIKEIKKSFTILYRNMKKNTDLIAIVTISFAILFSCDLIMDVVLTQERDEVLNYCSRDGVVQADIEDFPEIKDLNIQNVVYSISVKDGFKLNFSSQSQNYSREIRIFAIDYDKISSDEFYERNYDIFENSMNFSEKNGVYISKNLDGLQSMTYNTSEGLLNQWNLTENPEFESQVPILGNLDINNYEKFFLLFDRSDGDHYQTEIYFNQMIIFGDCDFIYNTFLENFTSSWNSYLNLNIIFKQNSYLKNNIAATVSALNAKLDLKIKEIDSEYDLNYLHYYSAVCQDLNALIYEFRGYEIIYWIISIPLMVLMFLLLKNVVSSIITNIYPLIGKLRTHGVGEKEISISLKAVIYLKTSIGIILGMISGIILTFIITNITWNTSLRDFIEITDNGSGPLSCLSILTIIKEILIIIVFLHIILKKKMKSFLSQDPADFSKPQYHNYENFNVSGEFIENDKKKGLSTTQSLILGVSPFLLYPIMTILNSIDLPLSDTFLTISYIIEQIIGLTCLISPILIIISLIHLLGNNKDKLVYFFNRLSSKKRNIKNYIHRKIGGNWQKIQIKLNFISISLIIIYMFFVMANVAEQSNYRASFSDHSSVLKISCIPSDLSETSPSELIDDFQEHSNSFGLYSVLPVVRTQNLTYTFLYNNGNWQEKMPPLSSWIEEDSWESILKALFNGDEASAIISNSYAQNNNVEVGDLVEISYVNLENESVTKDVRIVGIFNEFFGWYQDIYMNFEDFLDIKIRDVRFYCETLENQNFDPTIQFNFNDIFEFFYKDHPYAVISLYSESSDPQEKMMAILVNFTYIDIVFFAIFIVIGYAIIMKAEISGQIREICQLRIKGIDTTTIKHMLLYEQILMVGSGVVISLIGLGGIPLFLPALRSILDQTYDFHFSWISMMILLGIFIIILFGVINFLVSRIMKQIDKQQIERILIKN